MQEDRVSDTTAYLHLLAQAEAATAAAAWGEAAALWEQIVAMNPVAGSGWERLAEAHDHAGSYREAVAGYRKMLELGVGFPSDAAYRIACCYARSGETEQAFGWLERAFAMGYRYLQHSQTDPDLRPLHADKRFPQIVGLVELGSLSRDEGWRSDLALLAREVKRKGYLPFRRVPVDEWDDQVRALSGAIPTLSDVQVAAEMMKLLRQIGDGHTGVIAWGENPNFLPSLPLQFYLFEEGLFVIAAAPVYVNLLGARVLRFGESTVEDVMRALDPLIQRDNELWPKQVAPYLMRSAPLLHALGLITDSQQAQLTIHDQSGNLRTVSVRTETNHPDIWNTFPYPAGWRFFPETLTPPLPLYLRDTATNYWFEYLTDRQVVYFQFNRVADALKESLSRFCSRLFAFIDEHEVERLIIDMRWNNGGNTFLEMPLLHGLISSKKINRRGRLFVIIARRTFSAAQNGATFIERHTNAIFVGEPTGSSPNFVGEETAFVLPYCKLVVNVSDLYWQSSWPLDYRTWIAPQLYTPPTFAAYRANGDPALDAALAYPAQEESGMPTTG